MLLLVVEVSSLKVTFRTLLSSNWVMLAMELRIASRTDSRCVVVIVVISKPFKVTVPVNVVTTFVGVKVGSLEVCPISVGFLEGVNVGLKVGVLEGEYVLGTVLEVVGNDVGWELGSFEVL